MSGEIQDEFLKITMKVKKNVHAMIISNPDPKWLNT